MSEKEVQYAKSFKEQFTLRGMIIGTIGAMIITTSFHVCGAKNGSFALADYFCGFGFHVFFENLRSHKYQ